MNRFSANLGFLWQELDLPDAIRAAHRAGFDAVECHWPYETPAKLIANTLDETGLEMLSINTVRGAVEHGEFGTAALPGREEQTRTAIEQAIDYASQIGKPAIHVLAGKSGGDAARMTFLDNLGYACSKAEAHGITILIEPVNTRDIPGYFLSRTAQAISLIQELGADNLKLMFDCYHVQIMEADVLSCLETAWPFVGHVQFSSVPGRGRPDEGEPDFEPIFRRLSDLGYNRPLGAEYHPAGPTDRTLGWLEHYR